MQKKYDKLAEQGDRPKRIYIEKYSYLIENLYKNNYDWKKISANHPFLIQGVLFNSILCKSELDLGKTAEVLEYDAQVHYERADKDCVALPSYDMCQVDFEGEFYWRGPVWVNINWYIAQGGQAVWRSRACRVD
jgi:hypothetical protein